MVAVRYAQRQALTIVRMIEKPQLAAPPGLSLMCTDNDTILSGADKVTGPLAMITTSRPFYGSDLGMRTNIIIDEKAPQYSTTILSHTCLGVKSTHASDGADSTSQLVPDDKITTRLPIGYLDGCSIVHHEAGFLDKKDLARLRIVSRCYGDIVADMTGEKHDYFGNRTHLSTADIVKRSPSKTSRPRWGSEIPSEAESPLVLSPTAAPPQTPALPPFSGVFSASLFTKLNDIKDAKVRSLKLGQTLVMLREQHENLSKAYNVPPGEIANLMKLLHEEFGPLFDEDHLKVFGHLRG